MPSPEEPRVTVFQYKAWNPTKWKTELADHKATRDEIGRRHGAVVEDSGEDVPLSALDENNCYRPAG